MKIHKIEAAQRQLDTAISLFFSDGDPCSIITLAGASEDILGNYISGDWVKDNEENIFGHMYKMSISRGLNYKDKKEFSRNLVNATKNSLKHADVGEEQYVEFDKEEIIFRLNRALINYQTGSGLKFSTQMNNFETWLRNNRPEYLSPMGN